jgi:hypothetical protein
VPAKTKEKIQYKQRKKKGLNKKEAMKHPLSSSFS